MIREGEVVKKVVSFDLEYTLSKLQRKVFSTNLVENSKKWRRVTKKRENLDDVIKYEDIAIINDSILRIAKMSDSDKLAFFKDYTDK